MDERITVIRPVLGFVAGLFFFFSGLSSLLQSFSKYYSSVKVSEVFATFETSRGRK